MNAELNHRLGFLHLDTHSTNIRNHNRRKSSRFVFISERDETRDASRFRLPKICLTRVLTHGTIGGANRADGDDASQKNIPSRSFYSRATGSAEQDRGKSFMSFHRFSLAFSCCLRERASAGERRGGMFIELPKG
jgi:hypothetical protein